MFDRKQYDRRRYADFQQRRAAVMLLFGGKCWLCEKPAETGFHLHHKEYHPTESDYPRHARTFWVRLKRLKEAEEHPERFCLLCDNDHKLVERCKHRASIKVKNKPEAFLEKLKQLVDTTKKEERIVDPLVPF